MDFAEVKKELTKEGEIVTHILEKWAEEGKDRPFIYYGEEDLKLTFNEFNHIANSIGHNLRPLGISKGDRISVFMKNPFISTMVMFGIRKTGAVFCPVNFNYKGRLLSYQINDTNYNDGKGINSLVE